MQINYFSALGVDNLSRSLLAAWESEGINTDNVFLDQKRLPGVYVIDNDEYGERSFMFWRSESAAKYMFKQDSLFEWLDQLIQNDYIFVSGVTLAILDMESRSILNLTLKKAKAQGAKIIFDNN